MLEIELNKSLTFSYSIVGNLSQPESRRIHLLDRFRFKVWVRNNGSLPMRNIRGVIRGTDLVSFTSTPFAVLLLGPYEEREVAQIDTRILRAAERGSVFDQLATVNLQGQPDLSEFYFRDSRTLTYVQPSQGTAERTEPARQVAGQSPSRRALPLTGVLNES
jgi:hypothetical protein